MPVLWASLHHTLPPQLHRNASCFTRLPLRRSCGVTRDVIDRRGTCVGFIRDWWHPGRWCRAYRRATVIITIIDEHQEVVCCQLLVTTYPPWATSIALIPCLSRSSTFGPIPGDDGAGRIMPGYLTASYRQLRLRFVSLI